MPTPEDNKCPPAKGAVAVMIMNGTRDPINPFEGGELSFHGLINMGPVLSTQGTTRYFLREADSSGNPKISRTPEKEGEADTWIERKTWAPEGWAEVRQVSVHGGGHSIPQQGYRFARMYGNTSSAIDSAVEVWSFFQQQK